MKLKAASPVFLVARSHHSQRHGLKILHHLRTANSTRWALILVLWVVLVCLMKNMNVLSAACSVSASQPSSGVLQSNTTQDLTSLSDNNVDNKAQIYNQSECHLSEKLLQFHSHQLDNVVISSLLPSLMIAVFLWFSLTCHRILHKPPVPKRRRHLEFCTFQE
ncbi:hypothetical protein HC725_07120 [Vibrio sp. S17_S38]|uniref:hypothetical protein n=1 Tax=Vibrio sp. S17_S38 TaxID=2720229 RepID=UPI0016812F57|nr:hypothetical protein [Vibrio sp. S17_S38]MBD1573048.1 hypothetical protein [Vibrio sp. S17_S38]